MFGGQSVEGLGAKALGRGQMVRELLGVDLDPRNGPSSSGSSLPCTCLFKKFI